ncbi:MAG: CPBP family intramembrane glutamic endopeptidase [Streptosporangiaceae bacterium]
MSVQGWVWRAPPGWPEPPPGWTPPPGWQAPADWPQPPADWVFWAPADAQEPAVQAQEFQPPQQQTGSKTQQFPVPQQPPPPQQQQLPPQAQQQPPPRQMRPQPLPRIEGRSRRGIVLETCFVQIAFLAPGVLSAVDLLAAHFGGAPGVNPFSSIIPGHPLANVIFGMLTYLQVGAVVPLALLLLSRTGQDPASIGFTRPEFRRDVWPGIGLAASGYAASYVSGVVIVAVLATAIGRQTALRLFNQVTIGHVPAYYILYGVTIAAVTAITEETLVNAYLLTRLEQLGWNPRWALVFSLTLRTSYHVYYGLGFLFTIPLGYFNTRSFQKHRSVMRPIVAHFLYDAVLFTVSVLVS